MSFIMRESAYAERTMAESPIKLFATRAERYPEPTEADIAHSAARAALSVIPFLGGPASELLSMVLVPAVAKRRDEWLKLTKEITGMQFRLQLPSSRVK
jgi:hypothetical protein